MSNPIERITKTVIGGDSQKAALVYSGINRFYLSGFRADDGGVLLVTAEESYLLMDFRYAEAARMKAQNVTVVDFDVLDTAVKALLKKHNIHTLQMEYEALPYGVAKHYETLCGDCGVTPVFDKALDDAIRSQRIIKSAEEIEKISAAQAITDAAFDHILPQIREGVTERALALEIEFFMRQQGAEGVAFNLIVVAGANGSQCHGVPGDTKLKKGDFITMDTGALLDGYHSDMTRTVALGAISDEQKAVYDTVLKAQLAAIDAIHAGVCCKDVDRVARDIIETPYPGTFGHGLGHGVGVEIHEWPRFSKADSTICAPGMVVTVEPGIYIPGRFGVRIEDMIVVTEDGCRDLTHSPKALICL